MQKNNPPSQAISLNAPARARLFFALWPEAACRNQLSATGRKLAMVCGGRLMRTETLHMTLLFIGPVDRSLIPLLETAASGLRFSSFEFGLDRLACWRHNRIAYAAPEVAPEALRHLATQLRAAVDATGIGVDRKPFVPHVTLLRNIERNFIAQTISPLNWTVSSVALVESVSTGHGVQYRKLHTWDADQHDQLR